MANFEQNSIIFNLYLLLAILILIVFFILISFNIVPLIIFWFRKKSFSNRLEFTGSNQAKLLFSIKYYIKTYQWFFCIAFIEYYMQSCIDDISYYYLGYCYQQLSYFEISLFYYLKIQLNSDYYKLSLANSIIIYDNLKLSQNVINTCNKLLKIESANNLANVYLQKYSNSG